MSASLGMKNITVRMFGERTEVPNNAIAKLMYYLDCVVAVIEYDDRTLTDYKNYNELTGKQLLEVYQLAKLLNPSLFLSAGIFILDQSLLLNLDNQFYEIKDETLGVHVNQEIIIGGRSVKVLKLMACNSRWLSSYYYNPINQIDTLIRRIIQENENHQPPKNIDFRTKPICTTCPYCRKTITTKVEETFNSLGCICCLLFNLIYCCVQMCADRALCFNFTHRYPICGRILGHYGTC